MYLHPALMADLSAQTRAEHARRGSGRGTRRARRFSPAPRAGPRPRVSLRRLRLVRA